MTFGFSRLGARETVVAAAGIVFLGSIGVQISSALMLGIFDSVGVFGASALRVAGAAVALLVVFRPRIRGRNRPQWGQILLFGATLAAMNTLLYCAIDRLPLGIAVTINFLGPCAVALSGSRRWREVVLALLAFGGVAVIAGPGGSMDPLGLLYAALAATSLGLYVVLAAKVGKQEGGFQTMTLSLVVGAVLLMPIGVPALPRVTTSDWAVLGVGATLGLAVPCVVDTIAGKLTSARVIGVLFATGPVVSVLVGILLLDQLLTSPALIGIAMVVAAGAGIVWFSESAAVPSTVGGDAGAERT